MYRSKLSKLAFIILVLSMLFSGCGAQPNNTSASSDNLGKPAKEIQFKEVEKLDPPKPAFFEWTQLNEEEIVSTSDLVVKGKVVDSREFEMEENGSKYYKTVFSVKVDDIYYAAANDGTKAGDTIKIMSSFSSHSFADEAIDLKKGQECILFTKYVVDSTTIKFTELAKYCVTNPWKPIILVSNDVYEFDGVFTSLSKNAVAKERKINEAQSLKMLQRNGPDFKNDLKAMISKAKTKK